ncbi:hypothetical protein [endosymbiont GvMRE of Glomus versiforme]|uniref:hypothetical protein n=1 Tax=endosymbiont GvMRE of Glomus versiforme TaxID=2039283 RepID=UPI0011C3FD75|nr:hypothetical protein [endosymbiont GvMRE of Glomus versiforme]
MKRKLWDEHLKKSSGEASTIEEFKVAIGENGYGYTIFSNDNSIKIQSSSARTNPLFNEFNQRKIPTFDEWHEKLGHLTLQQHNCNIQVLIGRRIALEEKLAIERRKFYNKPDCINKKNAQDIEWEIKLTQSEIDYHINQVGSNCDHINKPVTKYCQTCHSNQKTFLDDNNRCLKCGNIFDAGLGPNGFRDYEWMEKRVVEIGDLIFKLENEAVSLLSYCNCRKYDCHKCQEVRNLKEQILILDNERRELKEKINRTDLIPQDKKERDRKEFVEELNKALSERDGQETWEQEETSQEPGGDYSLTSFRERKYKYGEVCFDCGAKSELIITKYIECGICKERTEGDNNWRCEKCNDKKYKHFCKKLKNKPENEENKNNSSPNTINININNNSNAVNSDNNENKKLAQIIQEIEVLKQKIAQLEKTGKNPQKVEELKHQVQNLESQKAQLNQQTSKPVEKNMENEKKETTPNPAPAKPESHKTILLIGGGLLIASALVIGYFIGKNKKN